MKMNISNLAFPLGVPLVLELLQEEIKALRQKKLVITLDGYSSSGKSTIAKGIANLLQYLHVDSGAMYRAVTLQFLKADIDIKDREKVRDVLSQTIISFDRIEAQVSTLLNGENVEKEIRSMPVSNFVSPVAAIPEVRTYLVEQQRAMAGDVGIVMDGRDIGTVVFPGADIKFFIVADGNLRAERRFKELIDKGVTTTLEAVLANLTERDHIDTTREDSPLRQADDAILLDTSTLTPTQQIQKALSIIIEKTK